MGCSPEILACDECFELVVNGCEVNVKAALPAGRTYFLFLENKFNNYVTPISVNADGSFDIDLTLYPDGMFNEHAGKFEVFLSDKLTPVNYTPLRISDAWYNCLIMNFTTQCCFGDLLLSDGAAVLVDSDGEFLLNGLLNINV